MCQDCGCGDPDVVPIDVQHRILAKNDATAAHNREHFTDDGILCVNLMGSPGAGKTAVLEATARARGDARRFAALVHRALHHFDLASVDYLFIENVGHLVCPAVYDLGQAVNVVALSVTEGEDKPLKYPTMFQKADLVLLTKTDLLRHLPHVKVDKIYDALSRVMPEPCVIPLSSLDDDGFDKWLSWLEARRAELQVPELA